jgi:hypothetical protein
MWNPKEKQLIFVCSKCGGPGVTTQKDINYYKETIQHTDPNVCMAVKRNTTKANKQIL